MAPRDTTRAPPATVLRTISSSAFFISGTTFSNSSNDFDDLHVNPMYSVFPVPDSSTTAPRLPTVILLSASTLMKSPDAAIFTAPTFMSSL